MNRRLLVLDVVVDVIVRTAIVFSLYLLFSGHNAPGGGFIAGLVAGISLILRYVAKGEEGMTSIIRVAPETLLGAGLAVSVLVAGAGWLWGGAFFDSSVYEAEIPVLGAVKATSALVFDAGVFLVVVGLVASLVMSIGDRSGRAA